MLRTNRTKPLFFLLALTLVLPACTRRESSSNNTTGTTAIPLVTIEPESGGKMVLLAGGDFIMGDRHGEEDESLHQIHVDSFYMDCYPVTQRLYEAIMEKNPSKWRSPDNPVEQLQWVDAVRFCNRCSKLEGLHPCYDLKTWECDFNANGYRLPTEAEWEYACRAGTKTRYSFGDSPTEIETYGWCKPHSRGKPHPVGTKLPNAWGLYDMHGNVWQWCNDFYSPVFYTGNSRQDPHGPTHGEQRVLRGGSWKSPAQECRSANREKEFPVFTDACFGADSYGFRRVRNAKGPDDKAEPTVASRPTATTIGGKDQGASNTAAHSANPRSAAKHASPAAHSVANATPSVASMPATTPESTATARTDAAPPKAVAAKSTATVNSLSNDSKLIAPTRLKGLLVFVSDQGGQLDIWIMKADGSNQKQLTRDEHADADPRFSPDGQHILYTSLREGFPQIWTMQRDGSAPKQLTEGAQAAWSPDSKSIVFIRDDQVFVRTLDSGTERKITPTEWNRCGVPAWNPAGTRIALASRHLGTIGIFLLDPTGKDPSQLEATDPCCTPAWSPSGKRIVFQTDKGHIHELDLATGQEEQLTFGADIQRDARYSPDGTMLTFCRAPTEEGPWQICVLDLESDNLDWVQLTHDGSNLLPDWTSADGNTK